MKLRAEVLKQPVLRIKVDKRVRDGVIYSMKFQIIEQTKRKSNRFTRVELNNDRLYYSYLYYYYCYLCSTFRVHSLLDD